MSTPATAPAATPAKLPGSLETNRRISTVDQDPRRRHRRDHARQGRDRPGHRHRARPDRRRRARRRARAHPHGAAPRTAFSPDEGVTSGSQSIQESGTALRWVCAEVRAIYLAAAAERLGVPADTLQGRGRRHPRRRQRRDQLLGARRRQAARSRGDGERQAASRRPRAASPASRCSASTSPTRCSAVRRFIHDHRRSPACCMAACCGRRVPARRSAALDDTKARALPGVVADRARRQFRRRRRRDRGRRDQGARAARARARRGKAASTLPDNARPRGLADARSRPRRPISAKQDGKRGRAEGQDDPARVHQALHRARLDRPVVRDRALDRRRQRRGRGRTARASTICATDIAHVLGLPLEQDRRRSTPRARAATATTRADDVGARRGAARARGARAGRCACCGRARTSWRGRRSAPAHDGRHRGRSRRQRRGRRMAPRHLEQRPHLAARPRQDPDAARRLSHRQGVPDGAVDQPAAGDGGGGADRNSIPRLRLPELDA